MKECMNCGCFNEPEPDGWSISFTSEGCRTDIKLKCPVCGSKMDDDT